MMDYLACPKCQSNHVRLSHTKGMRERLLKHLGWRAYRCREKSCRWRGLLKTEPTRGIIIEFMSLHKPTLVGLGIAVGIIVILAPLLLIGTD
jgi:hypothetical protein